MPTDSLICHRCAYESPPGDTQTFCPKDGTHLVDAGEHRKSPRDPFLGTTIGGKYPILGLLGQGGMGAVYRSVQPIVEREVALKLILPVPGLDTEVAGKRFVREAQAIAAVSHPSIVTLHDFGAEDDGTLFMVLELVRGRTLSEALRDGSLNWVGLVDVICEVLSALEAAHPKGLIHRDLKPDNVMLLNNPSEHHGIKVLDFGLARVSDTATAARLTRTGAVFGTPQYMSPEQSVGQDVDGRADLYSVGVMLYEGLCGRVPFESDRPLAVLRAQIEETPPALPDHVPLELQALVMKALAKERDDRFASASAMRSTLSSLRGLVDLDLAPTRKWDPDAVDGGTGPATPGTLMGRPGSSSPDAVAVTGALPAPEPIPPSIAPPRPPQKMAPSLRTLGDATGELEATEEGPRRNMWIWGIAAAGVVALLVLGVTLQPDPPPVRPRPNVIKAAAQPVIDPLPAPAPAPMPAPAPTPPVAAPADDADDADDPDAGTADVQKRPKKRRKARAESHAESHAETRYEPMPAPPPAPTAIPPLSPAPPPVVAPTPAPTPPRPAPKRRRLDLSKRKLQ